MIRRRRLPRILSVLTAAVALVAVTQAPAQQTLRDITIITPDGVGPVQLGETAAALRNKGLIKPVGPGCELSPDSKAAVLKNPLEGSVQFAPDRPLRVDNILILGGAKARGVGVLDRKRKLKNKFPGVTFDRSTIDVFGIILATVPKRAGGKLQFTINPSDKRILSIGIPHIPFCE